MAKYVKKPVEIEAITFDELMRIGAENARGRFSHDKR